MGCMDSIRFIRAHLSFPWDKDSLETITPIIFHLIQSSETRRFRKSGNGASLEGGSFVSYPEPDVGVRRFGSK